MNGVWCLVFLWTLITLYAGPGQCSSIQFLERDEGDSVVLSCLVDNTQPPPFGVYLRRSWLRPSDVLFQYELSELSVLDQDYRNRTTASGDPSISVLNVTLSHLRPSDTDRYHCVFNVNNPRSEDSVLPANNEFFLLVRGADTAPVEREWVDTCVGGSAMLPCVPPVGDSSAVEGVILKRQRGQQPVDILYHSKHSPSSSEFSVDRVQLSTAPGPGGISYSLTVGPLQAEDTGLYSCQLLLQGRPPGRSMGRRGLYVSVKGHQCGCSSYSALIYALSSAVAVTFILLLVIVSMYRGKQRRAVKTHIPAPIYEEMTGLQSKSPKGSLDHLEGQSEYRNISGKKICSENHYESPNGALGPKKE